MKTYKITFDNGQERNLTVFDDATDPALEIAKSKPLDSDIENAEILSIQEVAP